MIDHEPRKRLLMDGVWLSFTTLAKHVMSELLLHNLRGPELLVDYQMYDYSLAKWSLAWVVRWRISFSGRSHFPMDVTDDPLVRIAKVLGTEIYLTTLTYATLN